MKFILKELWLNLNNTEKNKVFLILFMMIFVLLFETFVISQVYFIFKILTNQNINFIFFFDLNKYIYSLEYKKLIVFSLCYLNIIYFFKNIYIGFFIYVEKKYIAGIQLKITEKLFKNYIKRPYIFHTENNSSYLINKVYYESQFFESTLVQSLTFLTELLLLFFIALFVLITEPVIGIAIISLFSLIAFCIYKILNKKINKWSELRHKSSNETIKNLNFFFNSFKILKIYGKEKQFIKNFSLNFFKILNYSKFYKIINSYPRLFYEIFFIIALTILVLSIMLEARNISDTIPVAALFGAVAFRILPSFNRISNNIQAIQNAKPILEKLLKDLSYKFKNNTKFFIDSFPNNISFENIFFKYKNNSKQIVKNLSLEIKKNDYIGIIGASGLGKTTFLNLLLGLFHPQQGVIKINNKKIDIKNYQFRGCVGYVTQSIYLSDDSLLNNIVFGQKGEKIDLIKVQKALNLSGLSNFIKSLPLGLDTHIGENGIKISGGQRQKIAIAQSLYYDPDLIIFDEATSSLDLASESEILDSIQEIRKKKTIIIVSHRNSTLKYCEKVFKLENGSLKSVKI
jgi:ABC-type bacteriocin/lantibiotic exporter with double-glycine peptidase domain